MTLARASQEMLASPAGDSQGGPLTQGDAGPEGSWRAPLCGYTALISPHYLVAFQSSLRDPTDSRSSHMVVSVSFPPASTKHCPAKAVVASGESSW